MTEDEVFGIVSSEVVKHGLLGGYQTFRLAFDGHVPPESAQDLHSLTNDLDVVLSDGSVYREVPSSKDKATQWVVRASNNTAFWWSTHGDSLPPTKKGEILQRVEFQLTTTEKERYDKIVKLLKETAVENPSWPRDTQNHRNNVYIAVMGPQGLEYKSLGKGGVPLIRENYAADVLKDFDYITKSMRATDPGGRLTILDGPPGTGKTYFVRGLINAVPQCQFLIFPATLVREIDKPGFTQVLARMSAVNPIVLIVEDGDEALSARKAENMSLISSLLNATDGIVGSLLDIRVVVTTNTPDMEFDPAALRAGRLLKNTHISKIPLEQARARFVQLTGGGPSDAALAVQDDTILAEVYHAARKHMEVKG
jgi:hypothetical protein